MRKRKQAARPPEPEVLPDLSTLEKRAVWDAGQISESIELKMSGSEALLLLLQLQADLTSKFYLRGKKAIELLEPDVLKQIAKELEKQICVTPALKEFCKKQWRK